MAIGDARVPTDITDVVVRGDDYTFTVTATKNGATYDLLTSTIICSIKQQGTSSLLVTDFACVITNASSGIFEIRLTPTETTALIGGAAADSTAVVTHIADFQITESDTSDIFHGGLFRFDVRAPVTSNPA